MTPEEIKEFMERMPEMRKRLGHEAVYPSPSYLSVPETECQLMDALRIIEAQQKETNCLSRGISGIGQLLAEQRTVIEAQEQKIVKLQAIVDMQDFGIRGLQEEIKGYHQHTINTASRIGELEQQLSITRRTLEGLSNAAQVYSASQDSATDPRCGLVQPISVEDGKELNIALALAHAALRHMSKEVGE